MAVFIRWVVKDNEKGKVYSFSYRYSNWKTALAAYIKATYHLSAEDAEKAVDGFNGEIWAHNDIEDINVGYLRPEHGLKATKMPK